MSSSVSLSSSLASSTSFGGSSASSSVTSTIFSSWTFFLDLPMTLGGIASAAPEGETEKKSTREATKWLGQVQEERPGGEDRRGDRGGGGGAAEGSRRGA